MKTVCVLITRLPAKAELRRRPHLKDRPALIAEHSRAKATALDRFPATTPVAPGAPLAQALSRQPEAIVLDADEPHYRRVSQQALSALQDVSDRVEDAGLGLAYAALDGLQALYGGGGENLVKALLDAVPQYLQLRTGVGQGKFPALAAALSASPLEAAWVPEDAANFLAVRPVSLLPVSGAALKALRRFGLHTLGQVAAMRPEHLADQFGAGGALAWNLAHGQDDSPLIPLKSQETITEETSLPFASASLELLLAATDALLRRAYARPALKGCYAGQAILECPAFNAAPWRKTVNFQEGVGRWERAAHIIRNKLEAEPPVQPVDGLVLTLSGFTGEPGAQLSLLPGLRDSRRERLAEVEQRLQLRQASIPALYRVVTAAPWHPAPEMRAAKAPLDSKQDSILPLLTPREAEVKEDENQRPRMVKHRGDWQQVARIEDCWTFDLWWLPQPMTRDYYRVERQDGGHATLFRDQHNNCWFRQGS